MTELCSQRLVLRTFAAGRLLRGCVFPTISGALDTQMDARRYQSHHYYSDGLGDRDDLLEPSSSTMAARRAAVEGLPATTLIQETAAAGQLPHLPPCQHAHNLPLC
jgi:hypothetical protein